MRSDLTRDTLFAGQLVLDQPARGHRIGTDAVLLAAACPPESGHVVDLGCGAGAVGLRAAQCAPGRQVVMIDNDPFMVGLAGQNSLANGLASRCIAVHGDANAGPAPLAFADGAPLADAVLTNPPFAVPGSGSRSPDRRRAAAHVLDGSLDRWVRTALGLLQPRGRLVMVHRADALGQILALLDRRFGDIAVLPVHPRDGEPAHRILVSARKGSRAPLRLLAPLILHAEEGRFTEQAAALHAGAAAICWSADQHTRMRRTM